MPQSVTSASAGKVPLGTAGRDWGSTSALVEIDLAMGATIHTFGAIGFVGSMLACVLVLSCHNAEQLTTRSGV